MAGGSIGLYELWEGKGLRFAVFGSILGCLFHCFVLDGVACCALHVSRLRRPLHTCSSAVADEAAAVLVFSSCI